MQTRCLQVVQRFAEAKNDAPFLLVDLIDTQKPVNGHQEESRKAQHSTRQARAAAASVTLSTAENTRELRLQLADGFVQIRWSLIPTVTPGVFVPPAWLIPRHVQFSPR